MVQNEKLLCKMSLSGRKNSISIIIGKKFQKNIEMLFKNI